MNNLVKLAVLLGAWLTVSACVSTGAKEITQPECTTRLEAGKSTQAEVRGLLGLPALVTYGKKGEETWNYYYITEYPRAVDFVPVVVALADGFNQGTRVLTVSFDRRGVLQDLQPGRSTGKAEVFPY